MHIIKNDLNKNNIDNFWMINSANLTSGDLDVSIKNDINFAGITNPALLTQIEDIFGQIDHLTVDGIFDISNSDISILPNNIICENDFNIEGCKNIKELPDFNQIEYADTTKYKNVYGMSDYTYKSTYVKGYLYFSPDHLKKIPQSCKNLKAIAIKNNYWTGALSANIGQIEYK